MKNAMWRLCALAMGAGFMVPASAGQIGTVFYIDMENHNLTQPSGVTRSPATPRQCRRPLSEQPHHPRQPERRTDLLRQQLLQRGARSPSVAAELSLAGSRHQFRRVQRQPTLRPRRREPGERAELQRAAPGRRHLLEVVPGRHRPQYPTGQVLPKSQWTVP